MHSVGRALAVGVVIVLMGWAGVAVGGTVDEGSELAIVDELDVDPDHVLLYADIADDGTAMWQIEYRVGLEDDDTEQAFTELEEAIADDPQAYEDRFFERMSASAAEAERATDREMSIEDLSVSTDRRFVEQEYGLVTYRFNWTSFAAVDGSSMTVGDALDGLFLPADTTLLISWSETYTATDVTPSADRTEDRAVSWIGPADFLANEPRIELTTDPGDAEGIGGIPMWAVILAGVLALVGVAGWYRRSHQPLSSTETADATAQGPDELLSNEERVIRLVEENGGRMKQQEVAKTLGWTDAKTSKVVRTLRDDGRLEGFRLGRENVLRIPGDDDDT